MHEEELRALRFEVEETRKVYRVFASIDKKNVGWVHYQRVLQYCRIHDSNFVKSIFLVFDKRKTNFICFRDFFMIVYDYCTLANQQLVEFIFRHYDEDGGGTIEVSEAQKLIEDMYGRDYQKHKEPRKVHALLTLKATTEVGGISYENFLELAKMYPSFLQSCRELQTLLRQRIVNWEFWMKHSKKRIQNYGNKVYIPLSYIFKKQNAELRRPEMPRFVKRFGVRQEEDSEGGDDEEWGLNDVKPFEVLIEEMKKGDPNSLKPTSIEHLEISEKLLKSYMQVASPGENSSTLMYLYLYFDI